MTDTTIKQNKPWMKILLIVSLGLNLAVVGLVIGMKVSHHGSRAIPYSGSAGMRALMHALPQEKRAEVRKYFHQNHKRKLNKNNAAHGSLDTISAAIKAQPFDAKALDEAFNDQRKHIVSITQNAQQAFVAIIADMTDQERSAYVDNMKKQRDKWRKKHTGKSKD